MIPTSGAETGRRIWLQVWLEAGVWVLPRIHAHYLVLLSPSWLHFHACFPQEAIHWIPESVVCQLQIKASKQGGKQINKSLLSSRAPTKDLDQHSLEQWMA